MTLRRVLPLVVLGGTILVLAVPLVLGDGVARSRSGAALASVALVAAVIVRGRAGEHADDRALVRLADGLRTNGATLLGSAVAVAALVLWTSAPGSASREDVGWLGAVVATVAGAGLVTSIVWGVRAIVRWEGVERQTLVQATSLAFFVTVLLAGVYGLFEVLADAPRLSMLSIWTVGMATWSVAALVLHRRVA